MLTMDDIIREGHPTLTQKAEPLPLPMSERDKETLKAMRQLLINSQDETIAKQYALRPGIGLAAPQIDVSKRMLAIYTVDENLETLHDYMMVNPKLIAHTESQTYMPGGEGCLSVDRDIEGLVPRHKRVRVKTWLYDHKQDTLKEAELKLNGFLSIVFQHELDHLNGVMFFDRIKPTLEDIEPVRFKVVDDEPNTVEN